MTRNGYFEMLPREMVREILNKISKLEDMASCRRACKLFYETSMMYGRDIFLTLYKKELGCLIRSENMSCHMLQGFYFNFFPAIRHAIRNGKKISHKYIDVEIKDLRNGTQNKNFYEKRLRLWKRILKYLPVKKSFIKHTIKKWVKSIIKFNTDTLEYSSDTLEFRFSTESSSEIYVDFYSNLFEIFVIDGYRKTNNDHSEFLEYMKKIENVKISARTELKIEKFKSILDRLL
jgi:hypothetical protein